VSASPDAAPAARAGRGATALSPGPGERAEQRVALFVDTQNLFYAARDAAGRFLDYEHLLRVAARGRHL
jgi:hypothetical protein